MFCVCRTKFSQSYAFVYVFFPMAYQEFSIQYLFELGVFFSLQKQKNTRGIELNLTVIFCKHGCRTLPTSKRRLFATILDPERSPEFSFVNTINRRREFHFIFKLACSREKYRFYLEKENVFDHYHVENFISILFTENILWTFSS